MDEVKHLDRDTVIIWSRDEKLEDFLRNAKALV
jgi:hypothetical protein